MRDMFKGVFCEVSHLGTKEACIGGEEVGRNVGEKSGVRGYRACQEERDREGGRKGEEGARRGRGGMECAGMGFGGMLEIWICVRVFLCGIKNTTDHPELSRKNRLRGRQRGKHRAGCQPEHIVTNAGSSFVVSRAHPDPPGDLSFQNSL